MKIAPIRALMDLSFVVKTMTRITQLKKVRKFMPEVLDENFEEKSRRVAYECPVCLKEMLIAPGQIQGCHRECRKEFKRRLKIQNETEMSNVFEANEQKND